MTSATFYTCCDQTRRSRVRDSALNGIDFLEVEDGADKARRQRFLRVSLLNTNHIDTLGVANVRVDGGERVRGLRVKAVSAAGDTLTVELDRPGDFSRYTLRLVQGARSDAPPAGFDPQLAAIEFSFKVQCVGQTEFLAEFDCGAPAAQDDDDPPAPPIDYLARDYPNLRRLLIDRVAALVPGFRDRGPVDPGVALLEILADAADQLAYQQDALAGEAYLSTARRRVSVRRHARLVDYLVHDGCNARTWAQLLVTDNVPLVPAGTPLATAIPGQPARLTADAALTQLRRAAAVFETVHDVRALRPAHNEMRVYTWSCAHCTLPRGSTRATLVDDPAAPLALERGDVVILEEVRGRATGRPEDADPTRRHAVRLTSASSGKDPLGDVPIVEIAWSPADALPFDLVVAEPGRTDIAVARGNVVLCDHGRTVGEPLAEPQTRHSGDPPPPGAPPLPSLHRAGPPAAADCCGCADAPATLLPPRFHPVLSRRPLTSAPPHDPTLPASASLVRPVEAAVPAITLGEPGRPELVWRARRDLLSSGPDTLAFTVETEQDGAAALRFGDGTHGKRPRPGAPLHARYRVGNGRAGQIGADALRHLVHPDPAIVGVRNPLPATGGVDPEDIETARVRAPHAFARNPVRAVTPADYAAVGESLPGVQRAAATFRWTGSFYTAVVDLDRLGGGVSDPELAAAALARLRRHALAGYDVVVREPIHVSVELELHVCADPGHFRSDIKTAVQAVFRGFFHPDNFTFGQPLHASAVVAAAQAVPGVQSVRVVLLRRQGDQQSTAPPGGVLEVGPREILRLSNDPNFAERGVLRVSVGGGK